MQVSLDFSYIEFVELLVFVYLCLSSNLENYYFSHYFTISLSLSFWEPHNAYIGLLLCIIGYPLAYVHFSSFFPLCSSDLFSGVLIPSYTYSSLMNPVSGFLFFQFSYIFQVQNFCSLYNFYLVFIIWFCSYIVFLISFTLLSKFSFIS